MSVPTPDADGLYKRKLSGTSLFLAKGAMPEELNYGDPIVSTLLWSTQKFEVARVVSDMQKLADGFVRMHSVPEGNRWKKVEGWTSAENVKEIQVSSEEEIWEFVEAKKTESMSNPAHPWWEVFILNSSSSRSLALFRVHHAIGDGISLTAIFCQILCGEDGMPIGLEAIGKLSGSSSSSSSSPRRKKETQYGIGTALSAIAKIPKVAMVPKGPFDTETAYLGPAPERRKAESSGKRKTVMLPSFSLEAVKKIAKSSEVPEGVTINDVLLSGFTGMLRRYCEFMGDDLFQYGSGDRSCCCGTTFNSRALVAFAMPRSPDELRDPEDALRNAFTFISCPLAVLAKKPLQRLTLTAASVDALKRSGEAFTAFNIQSFAQKTLPEAEVKKTGVGLLSRHTCVFSNVPGPQFPVWAFGNAVDEPGFIYPNVCQQVALVSYNGRICGNVCLDPEVVERSDVLGAFLLEEMQELAGEVGVPPESVLFSKDDPAAAMLEKLVASRKETVKYETVARPVAAAAVVAEGEGEGEGLRSRLGKSGAEGAGVDA
uniref:Uncharacterized protein n=1 Tax=Chromera velia CCMP2878 TaxID=1169474 RepID=A0A0G4HRM3_9ALVE|eukprot:Cvel_8101.t1-p1 / transcript=Cvel_8101.t1 / gene=Cvel_8101 / organism=Chromera_velia_CCMP2878 / gene_product=O-acyltransferase WSD, putative / transcript_product=O-acyltransferase WSD, putative / location=Cvel_scaffold440:62757-65341(+) / protein_length=542 / sequence_SO=supercontig / SO=protein_coding / is_pseudo=false